MELNLITRRELHRPLTPSEMDGNFEMIENAINKNAGGGGSTVEIVNDLTTGGATKALSAEQGKVLQNTKVTIPISLTYTELKTLIDTSALVVGQRYIINDYQTVHTIPNTSDTNTGQIEPLLVEALTVSKLKNECYSTLFPEDIIYYDIENNQSMVNGCTKGYIYRRIDTIKNNDIGFDYRNVKFRRWQIEVTDEHTDGDNNTYYKGSVVKKTGTNEIYLKINDVQGLFTDTSKWERFEWDNLQYVSPFEGNWYMNSYSLIVPTNSNYVDYNMFSTAPTVSGVQSSYDNIYGNYIMVNSSDIVSYSSTVFFGNGFSNNTIGDGFYYNTIGDGFSNNTIGKYFSYNTTGSYFQSNTIGSYSRYNTIGDGFYYNTIGDGFQSNTIGGYFSYNTTGDYFSYNTIGSYFQFNTIGDGFSNNTIGKYFSYNTIGDGFSNNTIGKYFSYNTIGDGFSNNGGIDFTSSTYVYQTYNKELFTNTNNGQYLKYYDENNVLQIVQANL